MARGAKKYTEELFKEGKKLREAKLTYKDIAKMQGFSTNFVAMVLKNDTFADFKNLTKKYHQQRTPQVKKAKKTEKTKKSEGEKIIKELKTYSLLDAPKAVKKDDRLDAIAESLKYIADTLDRMADEMERKKGWFRK